MVIGGAELFRAFMPRGGQRASHARARRRRRRHLWPALDEREWRVVEREPRAADERHAYAMTFEVWEKRTKRVKKCCARPVAAG